GTLHRFKDVYIPAAPANIPVQRFDDLRRVRSRVALEQRYGRQDHSGHAVAALHGAFLDEGFLDRMQFPVLRQSFDGLDFAPSDLRNLCLAGSDRTAIEQHGAGAALAFAAAVFGSREIQVFAQHLEQGAPGLCGNALRFSVERELKVGFHRFNALVDVDALVTLVAPPVHPVNANVRHANATRPGLWPTPHAPRFRRARAGPSNCRLPKSSLDRPSTSSPAPSSNRG